MIKLGDMAVHYREYMYRRLRQKTLTKISRKIYRLEGERGEGGVTHSPHSIHVQMFDDDIYIKKGLVACCHAFLCIFTSSRHTSYKLLVEYPLGVLIASAR